MNRENNSQPDVVRLRLPTPVHPLLFANTYLSIDSQPVLYKMKEIISLSWHFFSLLLLITMPLGHITKQLLVGPSRFPFEAFTLFLFFFSTHTHTHTKK